MTDKDIIKANDILDKFDFFNQRAGRELWGDKPKDVQEKDIRNFENDVKFLKDFINRQNSEIERLNEKIESLDTLVLSYADYVAKTRADAIKDFAERLKERFYSLEYKADTKRTTLPIDFVKDQMEWIFKCVCTETIDNLVKTMTQSESEKMSNCKLNHEGMCCNCGSPQFKKKCNVPCDCRMPMTNLEKIKSMNSEEGE